MVTTFRSILASRQALARTPPKHNSSTPSSPSDNSTTKIASPEKPTMAELISKPKRIVFTGGSGVIGQHVIASLLSKGHEVLNLDLVPLNNPKVHTIKTDLSDSGQVFNALSSHFSMHGFEDEELKSVDAVIHFAGLPRNLLVPDNETFRVNIIGTYNILEAASKLGIRKVLLASSQCIYGPVYAQGSTPYTYLPIDELYPVAPQDPYALSKHCNEVTAAGFVRRIPGLDVYALRIGLVATPEMYEGFALRNEWANFPGYPIERPEKGKRVAWSYCDVRDLGAIVHCAVQTDGLGWQVFNCVNAGSTLPDDVDVGRLVRRVCPETDIRAWKDGENGSREGPMSNNKARELLGFRQEWDWRVEVEKARKGGIVVKD